LGGVLTRSSYYYFAALFLLSALLFLLDFFSKAYILDPFSMTLSQYGHYGLPVFRDFLGIDFYITLTGNTGAAWGILSDYPQILIGIRIGIIALLLFYLFLVHHDWTFDLPLVLIITGAVGNIIDTFIYGFVVDFLFFRLWGYNFPVFNVADVLISVGVFLLLILLLRSKPKDVSSKQH
jgi:signal peptidase II